MILVRVETTGSCQVTSHTELSLMVLQKAVGGNVQMINPSCPDDGQIVAYCNEDGKIRNPPLQANLFAQAKLSVLFKNKCPPIVGPIVLCRSQGENDCGLTADDLMVIEGLFEVSFEIQEERLGEVLYYYYEYYYYYLLTQPHNTPTGDCTA
jgi:hypothetical protein